MNRKQAEHILDAYVETERAGGNDKACQSLREVILDAMTGYRSSTITVPNITYPSTTYPKPLVTYTGTGDPNVVQTSITSVEVGE